MKSIAVLGAFDTKGAELAYLIDCIHALAPLADVISVDVSARAHEGRILRHYPERGGSSSGRRNVGGPLIGRQAGGCHRDD